jgi:hypothetical protein
MSDEPKHFCPGCGLEQRRFDRYPWYFCGQCLATAEDGTGRRLVFGNASFGGGLRWGYEDDRSRFDDTATLVLCQIRKRRVAVHEARFGGVVAEPLNSVAQPGRDPKYLVDLTASTINQSALERLKPTETKR